MNRSHYIWLVLAMLLVGSVYSVRWIYPLYKEAVSGGNYAYVPLVFAPGHQEDDYFYYARVRSILDRGILCFDPVTYENRHIISPHTTYQGSFLMCSLAGLVTEKTEHAYYFNCFVYPVLSFLLAFLFIRRVVKQGYAAILLAGLAVLAGTFWLWALVAFFLGSDFGHAVISGNINLLKLTNMCRMPNILFTNVQLLAFVNLLFLTMELEARSIIATVGLVIVLAFASFTSTSNFILCYSIFCFTLISCRPKGSKLRLHLFILLVAGILSLPEAWLNTQLLYGMKEMWDYCDKDHMAYVTLKVFLRIGVYIAVPVPVLLLIKPPHAKFYLGVFTGVIVPYLLLGFGLDYYWGWEIWAKGADVLLTVVFLAALGSDFFDNTIKPGVFNRYLRWLRLKLRIPIGVITVLLVLIFVTGMLVNQYVIADKGCLTLDRPDFRDLYEWSLRNASVDDVALTLDGDLLTNLPALGRMNFYLPQAILSPTSARERFLRFYETAAYYGITPRDLENLLENIASLLPTTNPKFAAIKDYYSIRLWLLDMVLFYGVHRTKPMTKSDIDSMVAEYRHVLNTSKSLTYKADYLIVSKFDRDLIRPGSPAEKVVAQIPVFQNSQYSVYRLPNKDLAGSPS